MRFTWALGVLLLCAVPAKADNIGVSGGASFSDAIFDITDTTVTLVSNRLVEHVTTSFIYNTTSQQISDMNFNSDGPLGPFTFLGVNQPSTYSADFDWTSSQASLHLVIAHFPFPGDLFAGEGTKNLYMQCLTQSCNDNFTGGLRNINDEHSFTSFTWLSADSPSDTPSPTPEPSSLVLMGVGLVGIASLLRLKLIS